MGVAKCYLTTIGACPQVSYMHTQRKREAEGRGRINTIPVKGMGRYEYVTIIVTKEISIYNIIPNVHYPGQNAWQKYCRSLCPFLAKRFGKKIKRLKKGLLYQL